MVTLLHPAFLVTLAIEIFLGLAGILANLFCFILLIKVKLLHINPRLILLVIITAAIFHSVGELYISSSSFYTALAQNVSDLAVKSPQKCLALRLLTSFPHPVVVLSTITLIFERRKALKNPESYDENPGILYKVLFVLIPICTLFIYYGTVNFALPWKTTVPLYCTVFAFFPWYFVVPHIIGYWLIDVVCFAYYYKMIKKCRTELSDFASNQARLSLAGRIQLRRSIRLTEALFPSIITHTTIGGILTFSLVIENIIVKAQAGPSNDVVEIIVLQYATDITTGIYCLLFPILLIWKHDDLRENFKRLIFGRTKKAGNKTSAASLGYRGVVQETQSTSTSNSLFENHEQNLRFEHLNQLWSVKFEKRSKKQQLLTH